MQPLTEQQIRDSFVNATRREVNQATIPDLTTLAWDRLDYLGWRDERRPGAYVVLETEDGPVGVRLQTTPAQGRRKAMCAWCQDITVSDPALLWVARRGGAAGRRGDTVGTLICADLSCSRNVRRVPTVEEAGSDDPADRAAVVERRIGVLRERARAFAREVLQGHLPAAP
ncbi:FBP domain-containing protein [Arsenicicoccus dermatophilus]|uniref:FBP domain-containing protein n=1 Tax=Arsenicicoccus dermatophilus TaxID=1076331 RepID=UPI0039171ED4